MKSRLMLAKLAVAIVAAAGISAGVSTGNADAFSVPTSTLCPGTIQVPATKGYVNYGAFSIQFPDRYAWRSPCYPNYQQVISVTYRVFGFQRGTGWVLRSSTTRTSNADSTGAWIAGLFIPTPNADISVDVIVEWKLSNGVLIGSKRVDYDAIGDYACMNLLNCGVFSNPDVGAFIEFVTGY